MTNTIPATNRELSSFSEEELTSKEQSTIANINKDLTSFIVGEALSDDHSGSINIADILTKSLAADDPELAAELKDVLNDPEIVAAFDAYQRVTDGTATQADIDLLRAESEFATEPFTNVTERDPNNPNAGRGEIDAATQERVDIIDSVVDDFYEAPENPRKTDNVISTLVSNSAGSFGFLATVNGIADNIQGEYASHSTASLNTGVSTLAATSGLFFGGTNLYNGIVAAQEGKKLEAGFDITVGALGITRGLQSLTSIVVKKVAAKVGTSTASAVSTFLAPNAAAAAGTALGKAGAAFAIGIGSAVAIAAGTASLVRNAMAADEARRAGQHGVAAIYGTQAALDGVSTVLNVASLVADFLPGPGTVVSIILDSINLGITGINIGLGFLVDLAVDEDKLSEKAWEKYVNSPEFNRYIDGIGETFAEQGYDRLTVYVDSATQGVPDYGTGVVREHQANRNLTKDAADFPGSDELRLALLDQSQLGHELTGRNNDDYIDGGRGNDKIFGKGGNDLLFGGSGNDTVEGGTGNDRIEGGTGNDSLDGGLGDDQIFGGRGQDTSFGGAGNDRIELEIGIDNVVDGGDGDDVIQLSVADGYDTAALAGGNVEVNLETQTADLVYDRQQLIDSIKSQGLYETLRYEGNELSEVLDLRRQTGERLNSIYNFRQNHSGRTDVNVQDLEDQGFVYLASQQQGLGPKRWEIYYSFEQDKIVGIEHSIQYGNVTGYFERSDVGQTIADHYFNANQIADGFDSLFLIGLAGGYIVEDQETDFSNIESVIGTQFSDHIVGDEKSNYLDGGKASNARTYHDTVEGGAGDDIIVFNNFDDVLDGGDGHDTLRANYRSAADHRVVYDLGNNENYLENILTDGTFHKRTNLNNFESFVGSSAGDVVFGTEGDNYLDGRGGQDKIHGRDGDDYLVAGKGDDELFGDAGNDVLVGGKGNNILNGGEGIDTVAYNDHRVFVDLAKGTAVTDPQTDTNSDNNFTDTLIGIENVRSGKGWDILRGDNNNNVLNGGGIVDNLHGRGGDDTFVFNVKNNRDNWLLKRGHVGLVEGGEGVDTLDYSKLNHDLDVLKSSKLFHVTYLEAGYSDIYHDDFENGRLKLHNISGIENVINRDQGNSVVYGTGADNLVVSGRESTANSSSHFLGRGGNDTLVASLGQTHFTGGEGSDTLSFESVSKEKLSHEHLNIALSESEHHDGQQNISSGNGLVSGFLYDVENVTGHDGVDNITGNSADNILNGISGTDTIFGLDGDDTLIATAGTLNGGKGKDTYIVSSAARNLKLQDSNTDAEFGNNHIVFQGLNAEDVSVSISPFLDSIYFNTQVNGETVVLAQWEIRDQDLSFNDWGPLFKALNKTLEQITFIDNEGNATATFSEGALQKYFYDQFVVTDSDKDIFDDRGRHIEYNANNLDSGNSFVGTRGDDILDASATNDDVNFHTHNGSDILIGGSGKNTFTTSTIAGSTVIVANQGHGTIDILNKGSVVFVSGQSGDYTIKGGQSGSAEGTLALSDFSYESIKSVKKQENKLTITMHDGHKIVAEGNAENQLPIENIRLLNNEVVTVTEFINQFDEYRAGFKATETGDASNDVITVSYLGGKSSGHAGDDTFIISNERTTELGATGSILGGDGIDTVDYSNVEADQLNIVLNNHASHIASNQITNIFDGVDDNTQDESHSLNSIERVIGAVNANNNIQYRDRFALAGFGVTEIGTGFRKELEQFIAENYGPEFDSPDLEVIGGNLADKITLAEGNDIIDGRAGNDELKGGTGSDTYKFGRDYGQDVITDTGGDNDVLDISSLSMDELVFRQQGDDLIITQLDQGSTETLAGGSHSVTVKGQFSDDENGQIETVKVGDETLTTSDLNLLVQATATFLSNNGGEDSSNSLVIGNNYNSLSQIAVSALA